MNARAPLLSGLLSAFCALAGSVGSGGAPGASDAPEAEASSPAPVVHESAPSTMTTSDPKASAPAGQTSSDRGASTALETATFGAGCYWCVEAVLEQVDGVVDVKSGFMGGSIANPTYKEVCTGTTGHAEVVQVEFDPKRISYDELLDWFWRLHDPTTLNRQGADTGTQYRSAIFYSNDAQRAAAEKSKTAAQPHFKDPIVTEITKAGPFYSADDYHQDYYRANKSQGYCRMVIAPKLDKLGLEK